MTHRPSPISRPVICCACGRVLRGQPCLMPGRYLLREHYVDQRADRRPCPGARRLDHQPADERVPA